MAYWHGYLDDQLRSRPDAPSFADTGGLSWSYAELSQASDDLAAELRRAGVAAGARVVILAENCCPAVAAFFACSRIGATAVPVNARMSAAEVDRILAHACPAAVLATVLVRCSWRSPIPMSRRRRRRRR
jgi:acyl-CoA synthetase (AMP-forming)/AMP-acid ligase II